MEYRQRIFENAQYNLRGESMKIIHFVDTRGWGYARALEKDKIIATLSEKFKIDPKLAEQILNAYLDNLRGESTVYQDELLRNHKETADFLDTLVEEVDEETAKQYFLLSEEDVDLMVTDRQIEIEDAVEKFLRECGYENITFDVEDVPPTESIPPFKYEYRRIRVKFDENIALITIATLTFRNSELVDVKLASIEDAIKELQNAMR
jgi:hypothetical protein